MGEERAATGFDVRLGQRVRARRLELGISQEKLAEKLGVTFQQVQKYERGANRISASRLVDVASALGLPAGAFFEGLSTKEITDSSPRIAWDLLTSDEGVELALLFQTLSTKMRRRVIDLVKLMVKEAA